MMFFRILALLPLLHRLMLAEEVDEFVLQPQCRGDILSRIAIEGKQLASILKDNPDQLIVHYGKVHPRTGILKVLRRHRQYLWRIPGLHHPLWLGEDGDIYRGYYDWYAGVNMPVYWMRAEIERRQAEGLNRIVSAIETLLNDLRG